MVQYLFAKDIEGALLSGETAFILAPQRKRHAVLGDALEFRPEAKAPVVATAVCSFRATLRFDANGVRRVLAPFWSPPGEGVANLFLAAEQGAPQADEHCTSIALRDGFLSWSDLVAWHEVAQPAGADGVLVREVIGFSEVKPATDDAAAAPDEGEEEDDGEGGEPAPAETVQPPAPEAQ